MRRIRHTTSIASKNCSGAAISSSAYLLGAIRPAGEGSGDAELKCSPYSLFEIRLAERFGIPKLVLYERETGFKASPWSRPEDVYIAFRRAASEALLIETVSVDH